jgi:lipopolysaccharide biosynthesis glycosyltransferase
MVEHKRIDLKKKPLYDYVCDSAHSEWAVECSKFLEEFPLKAYCYQYPTANNYTCWYVSFEDKQNPYIIHFSIHQKGMTIWFRYPEDLPKSAKEQMKWDKSWQYMPIRELDKNIRQIVTDYVEKIRKPFYRGEVKGRIHKKMPSKATLTFTRLPLESDNGILQNKGHLYVMRFLGRKEHQKHSGLHATCKL